MLKVVTPYSKIEMKYLSDKLGVKEALVEKKTCQMILDGKLSATLDQEKNVLILFETVESSPSYALSLDILNNMEQVVDALFERADKLNTN